MEYKLILTGHVDKDVIEKTVKDWLRGAMPGQFGIGPPGTRRGLLTSPSDLLFPSLMNRNLGLGPREPVCLPPSESPFSSHQLTIRGQTKLSTKIAVSQYSEMGGNQIHTFILNDREMLVVLQDGLHLHWTRLPHAWNAPVSHPATAAMTAAPADDWGRLRAAMASGVRQLPGQLKDTVSKMVDGLLTWEGMGMLVLVTALFVLGGEVALILMGAYAVYRILNTLLPLLVRFYHQAIAARTTEQIEAAGKLFAQAIEEGALDIIDIFFAAGAYQRLLRLGGGVVTFRGVMVYLAERVTMLTNRLRQGTGSIKRLKQQAEEWARKQKEKKKLDNETTWTDKDGNIIWPPNDGFAGTPKPVTLQPGTKIDRYGYDGGTFVSPAGESYEGRSLAPGTENKPYTVFEVVKPIDATGGKVAPWFGKPGGNTQYRLGQSMDDLIKGGYVKVVTRTNPK